MSAPQKPEPPDSRPRRPPRSRRLVFGTGAGLLALIAITWIAQSPAPELHGPAPPPTKPGDHPPMPVCASADGTILRADVDGDGHVDEIRDPEREGTITVVSEEGDPPWWIGLDHALDRQELASLTTSELEARGTFGDFDGDGHVDMALFLSEPHSGDDPVDNMPVHEVRYGPLARDLTSERVGPIRIGWGGFVYGVRASDQDGDGRAELEVFQTAGDGGVDHFTGHQDDGGVSVDREVSGFHALSTWRETEPGWSDFGVCSDE